MQLHDDSILVLIKHFGVIDFLEVAVVGLRFVSDTVVNETGSSLEVLDHRWWHILNVSLVREVFLLTLDEELFEL